MSKKWKIAILASVIILVLVIVVDVVVVGKYMATKRKNQEAADKVIALISKIEKDPITIESENLLILTQTEYDLLTGRQKALVTNYSVLEKAFDDLQVQKDKKVAEDFSKEVDAINESTLTAEDTSVEKLLKEYDSLTKAQKSHVRNYDLLVRYNNVVEQRIAEKKRKESGMELAANFRAYSGKWGNFGGHVDVYQGMVEEAVRRDVNYKKWFEGDVDDLDFEIGRFTQGNVGYNIGVAYYCFWGPAKGSGYYTYIAGEVIINQDGSVYCTEVFR